MHHWHGLVPLVFEQATDHHLGNLTTESRAKLTRSNIRSEVKRTCIGNGK
jgi:hypothetical protein